MLVLVATLSYTVFSKKEPIITTQASEVQVERGNLVLGFESDGKSSLPFTNVDFEVTGKINEIFVIPGEKVKAGQILATLDATEYIRAYESAKLTYDKAVINYKSKIESLNLSHSTEADKVTGLKSSLAQIEKDYNNMIQVPDYYSQTEISAKKKELDDAKRAYTLAFTQQQVNIKSTYATSLEKLNMDTARLQMEEAKEKLDQTSLKAPKDGMVLQVTNTVGDQVSTSSDSGSLTADSKHFIIFTNSDVFEVVTSVSEQDLPMVKLNQEVEVVFEALQGKTYEGKVMAISTLPTIDSSGVVTYEVTTRLNERHEDIKIGMTATLQLIQKQEKEVLIIPNKAVTMEQGKQWVQVKGKDGTIEKRQIKAGLTDGRNVAVYSGLEVGETIIVNTKAE